MACLFELYKTSDYLSFSYRDPCLIENYCNNGYAAILSGQSRREGILFIMLPCLTRWTDVQHATSNNSSSCLLESTGFSAPIYRLREERVYFKL